MNAGLRAGSALDALQSASAVPRLVRGAITYVAGTTGAIATTTLFTVTGDVLLTSFRAKASTGLTSGGLPTVDIGVTGNTACFSTGMTDATTWTAGKWLENDGAVRTAVGRSLLTGGADLAALDAISADIIQTTSVATITGGVVRWYLSYIPLSADGNVALHANLSAF